MRKTIVVVVSMVATLVLASGAALLVPDEQARAAFPGKNGKIVFERDPDGSRGKEDSEIYTINFSGENLKRLTNNSTDDTDPAWSSDGKKIVFSGHKACCPNSSDIFVMDADGSEKTLVTDERQIPGTEKFDDESPAFSPNGRRIVFVRNYGIYRIGVDGNDATVVADFSDEPLCCPSWSPDGTKIAYYQFMAIGDFEYLWIRKPDGTFIRKFSDEGEVMIGPETDWSPDASKLVFSQKWGDILEMNADGTDEKVLTNKHEDKEPVYSPAGGKIAFARNRDGNYDIFVMDSDGTDVRPLTNHPGDDRHPNWQPVQ